MKHIVVIPYISQEEVNRLLQIGNYLKRHNENRSTYEFLLVNKKSISPDKELLDIFSGIAPSKQYQAETIFNTYPAGPSELFYKTMNYIYKVYEQDGGFVLWFESDMIPVASRWIDLLENEWVKWAGVLVMGLFIPRTFFIKGKYFVEEHINGGACYSKKIAKVLPADFGKTPFDISLFYRIHMRNKYHKSRLFKFSHMYSLLDDIQNKKVVILHGYLQNKNKFISKTINLIESSEARRSERQFLLALPKNRRICCRNAIFLCFFMGCPIHKKDCFIARCKNEIIWYLIRLIDYGKKILNKTKKIAR
jgi:hypothetical protein